MCSARLQHVLFPLSLIVFIYYNSWNARVVGLSLSLNDSEEIKNIFHSTSASKNSYEPFSKGISRTDSFAEGGLIDTNKTIPIQISSNPSTSILHKSLIEQNNFFKNVSSNVGGVNNSLLVDKVSSKENKSSIMSYNVRLPALNKLNETGDNLFLGVPEVVHLNGISSIKPRKGVYFNKIVPRKGVDIEIETNNSLSSINSCFSISHEDCYSNVDFNDTECSCCKNGNYLGKLIQQQPLIKCINCKVVKHLPLGEKESCQNICCKKKLENVTYPIPDNLNFHDNNSIHSYIDAKNNNSKTSKGKLINNDINFPKKTAIAKNVFSESFVKKLKPNITKVPYDVEVLTQLLSKSSKEVFVPIISIFSLILFGVLFYIIWSRTKEYWNNRYYKRMDFLIDGMYND